MSMRLILLLLLAMISNLTEGQVIVKEFFTKKDEPTNAANSYYYRVGEKVLMERGETERRIDTVFIDTVKTFYTSTNAIRSRSFYREGYQDGPYNFYHENGKLKEKGTFKKNQKIGYVTYWTDQGAVKKVFQYFYDDFSKRKEKDEKKESFKIIHYWDDGNIQLVKDGNGSCKCYLSKEEPEDGPLEVGKVHGGYRDSVWTVTSGDTLISTELYKNDVFIKGASTFKGKIFAYDEVIKSAEYTGGLQKMMLFLQKNIRYPAEAKRNGRQGRIFVKFFVDHEGFISNLSIIKGVSKELNDEAVRVIKLMPPWIPGTSRGIPVKTQFVLPVYFKLG